MTETATIGKSAQHGSITSPIDIVFPGEAQNEDFVGRSSMSIETKLWSENLLAGEGHLTAAGRFTMVTVDKDHRPVSVRDGAQAGAVSFVQGRM